MNDRTISRASIIADTMRTVATVDREWMGHEIAAGDERHTPWMPFSVPAFITLLAEAIPEATGTRFLEIGAGIGTRMLLAREIFGLDVHGFDRVPAYAEQALVLGVRVEVADAAGWKGYGDYDIIWFNRVFRDPVLQAQLEAQVWEDTAPGTVVMCANLENRPPSSWFIIDDDWETRRGVWQKLPVPG